MRLLTDRQYEVVKAISDAIKRGYPPTYAELCEKLNVSSKQTVRDLLDTLSRKGFLEREPNRARAILLTNLAEEEIINREDLRRFEHPVTNLDCSGSTASYDWGSNNNISIEYGQIDCRQKIICDNSYCINTLSSASASTSTVFQPVIEATNWAIMTDVTKQVLQNTSPIIVSTSVSEHIQNCGYTIFDGGQIYSIIWSGSGDNHYFFRGKEYGSSSYITHVPNIPGQLQSYPTSSDARTTALISVLRQELIKYSMWIDYPVYGGALKKKGEILWWSHSTANDLHDLQYLLLTDITSTMFLSTDVKLIRDVHSTLPNIKINLIDRR